MIFTLPVIVLFFLGVSFAKAYEGDSFTFLIEKTQQVLMRNSMLENSLSFIERKHEQEFSKAEFTLEQRSKNFLLTKWQQPASVKNGANISFFSDIDSYIEMDIWSVLEKSSDRTKTTDEYIAKGEILQSSLTSQKDISSSQIKGLKLKISKLKKEVSVDRKAYKTYLQGWNAEKINESTVLILDKSNTLLENQLELEKLEAYNRRFVNAEKNLNKKLVGAKENRDAFIKNVRVQSESGKFIDAIE